MLGERRSDSPTPSLPLAVALRLHLREDPARALRAVPSASASSASSLSNTSTYRAPSAALAAFSNRPWRPFNVIPFRGGRGRGFVLRATNTLRLLLLALSPPLLAKVIDDLLQSFARIGFAVSRCNDATSRVDAENFVQITLLIQCLRYRCARYER